MPQVLIPDVSTNENLTLAWGEWLWIVVLSTLASSIALEACLVTMATVWFGEPGRALLPLSDLIVMLFTAALIMRIVLINPPLQRLGLPCMVLGVIVMTLLTIRLHIFASLAGGDLSWLGSFGNVLNLTAELPHAELGIFLLSCIAWAIGLGLAQNAGDFDRRRSAFATNFGLILGCAIISTFIVSGRAALEGALALELPLYIVLGLITLSQVRLAEVSARMAQVGAGGSRTRRVWRITSIATSLMATIAVFIGGVLSYTGAYKAALSALGDEAGNVLFVLLLPITTVLFKVLSVIVFLINSAALAAQSPNCTVALTPTPTGTALAPTPTPIPGQPACSQTGFLGSAQRTGFMFPAQFVYPLAIALVLLTVLFIVVWRIRAVNRQKDREEIDETREGLDFIGVLREQFRPRRDTFNPVVDIPAPSTVRAAYREFLHANQRAGIVRDDDETPLEFRRRLVSALPTMPDEVESLTSHYEEERYGGVPPTPGRFAQAMAALRASVAAIPRPRRRG